MVTTGGRAGSSAPAPSVCACFVLDRRFLEQDGGVAHLLDDEHGRVLVDRLVDRGHDAHVHHGLDDFVGLDGHALRQLGDRDRSRRSARRA